MSLLPLTVSFVCVGARSKDSASVQGNIGTTNRDMIENDAAHTSISNRLMVFGQALKVHIVPRFQIMSFWLFQIHKF